MGGAAAMKNVEIYVRWETWMFVSIVSFFHSSVRLSFREMHDFTDKAASSWDYDSSTEWHWTIGKGVREGWEGGLTFNLLVTIEGIW